MPDRGPAPRDFQLVEKVLPVPAGLICDALQHPVAAPIDTVNFIFDPHIDPAVANALGKP